ncbi:hypothetical protein KSF73_11635 [Burkholderiaceae bacterium DAT-1]|nr:hypothetical protein [Burkholderiaceae bacterium DAT-1]
MKKLILLCLLYPTVCFAHPPAEMVNLASLYTDEMLTVLEQICIARAPSKAKQYSEAMTKWRAANQKQLRDIQQAADNVERMAYQKLGNAQSRQDKEAALSTLMIITTAKTWGANSASSSFAKLKDGEARSLCETYTREASNEAWMRAEMLSALKQASSLQ